ncbi:MAG: hypothetical protein ACREQZ_07880 [Woeseiaceae bacterium]
MPARNPKELQRGLATALGAEKDPSVPEILTLEPGDGELRVTLHVGADMPCFRGHFPGNPVLPGVLQLQWAVEISRLNFGFSRPPSQILRLKFKSIVVPPSRIELRITRGAGADVTFSYASEAGTHSQGLLRFDEGSR